MGLVTGGLIGRRFHIDTPLPDGFRDLFLEQVRSMAFTECEDARDGEARVGWVDVFDPAVNHFELNNVLIDRWIALTMRSDTKKVQGTYFKIAVARRVADVAAEQEGRAPSKSETEVISEALERELLARALPTVTTTDMAWDIHTGEVIAFTTSEGPLEALRQLVKETFGAVLRPEVTLDWLKHKLTVDEIRARIDGSLPGGAGTGEDPLQPHELTLASDFLLWLWLQSEHTDGLFRVVEARPTVSAADAATEVEDDSVDEVTESFRHADLSLWIDQRLKLRELTETDPSTTILLGAAPATTPEARQNLHGGKRPVEALLRLKLNELECTMTLQASTDGIRLSGLKVPFAVKTGREERLFERAGLLELIHATVHRLYQQFFLARTSPAWQGRLDTWLAAGVEQDREDSPKANTSKANPREDTSGLAA